MPTPPPYLAELAYALALRLDHELRMSLASRRTLTPQDSADLTLLGQVLDQVEGVVELPDYARDTARALHGVIHATDATTVGAHLTALGREPSLHRLVAERTPVLDARLLNRLLPEGQAALLRRTDLAAPARATYEEWLLRHDGADILIDGAVQASTPLHTLWSAALPDGPLARAAITAARDRLAQSLIPGPGLQRVLALLPELPPDLVAALAPRLVADSGVHGGLRVRLITDPSVPPAAVAAALSPATPAPGRHHDGGYEQARLWAAAGRRADIATPEIWPAFERVVLLTPPGALTHTAGTLTAPLHPQAAALLIRTLVARLAPSELVSLLERTTPEMLAPLTAADTFPLLRHPVAEVRLAMSRHLHRWPTTGRRP